MKPIVIGILCSFIMVGTIKADQPGVPKEVEALFPTDGKNTVIVQLDHEDNVYVLLENNDGEVGALFLYRFDNQTQAASVLKASESLFPFDAQDSRTPPKEIQTALAKAWAEHVAANYPGGIVKMTEYWRANQVGWKQLPEELREAFEEVGVKL